MDDDDDVDMPDLVDNGEENRYAYGPITNAMTVTNHYGVPQVESEAKHEAMVLPEAKSGAQFTDDKAYTEVSYCMLYPLLQRGAGPKIMGRAAEGGESIG